MGTLLLADYDVVHVLKLGKTVMRFTPTQTGKLPFT